jgi:hypothetical protein
MGSGQRKWPDRSVNPATRTWSHGDTPIDAAEAGIGFAAVCLRLTAAVIGP